ncbi:MAG: sigma-70 family RNA polymerase sigma factor [Solirubrobacterales bacterium]|nr:sigma-70 family RNA polymerase sigma factor [Solirubrobacterales bacterium]
MPTRPLSEAPLGAELDALVAHGQERGCVHESEIEAIATRLELPDGVVEDLRDQLAELEVDVHDDCGRAAPATAYANGDLATYTADAMTQFLARAGGHRLLTPPEEIELAKRIERGDLEAKERLVSHNLRLVVSIAKRYPVSVDLPLIGLVQEGTIGRIRAAEKFDWRRGFRFSTYATLWIRQAIGNALSSKSRVIRLPQQVDLEERKLAAAHHELATKLGRDPTIEEVAEASGLTVDRAMALRAAPRVTTSLDVPVGESGTSLGSLMPSDLPDVGEEVHVTLGHDAVRRAVAALTEPARSVIRLRYGLDGEEPLTYSAIGERLGISGEGARRYEKRGLQELQLERELEALADAA